ncbi:MAG: ribose 5-phosphate isomerase B [Armatimonadetes bacterium]|nr:ribose 5-phosphate isomerase B [Armatimonadota bacterium]
MKIILGSDHAGFELKEAIKKYLNDLNYKIVDYGTYSAEPVDYPDIAFLVASEVIKDSQNFGIIVDGVGVGSAICANKVPGSRAANCFDLFSARGSREHNDANILTLGGRVLGIGLACEIVKTFLESSFLGERHLRRVNKLIQLERKFLK